MKNPIGPRDKFPLMSEINMIPLIDVSLVLLIIFMVVTPFLVSSQIKINLPKAASGVPPGSEPIKVQITAKKTYYVNGEAALADDLISLLQRELASRRSPSVLIEADSKVPFDMVVRAMDAAKNAGAEKMGVGVTPESDRQ